MDKNELVVKNSDFTGIGIRYTEDDRCGTFMSMCTDGQWYPVSKIRDTFGLTQQKFPTKTIAKQRISIDSALSGRDMQCYDIIRTHISMDMGKMSQVLSELFDV